MKILDYDKARLVELNRQEYGENYEQINFINPEQAEYFNSIRDALMADILRTAESAYKDTKLDTRTLSPGCEICGAGSWSCLFVNGICNCNCFYCPAIQNQVDIPTTSSLQFENPESYIRYIEKFNFKGISLSGGEPLMTFEKSIGFLKAIRERFGHEKYIWLYTNGALVDEEKIAALKKYDLDEIRFDLSARSYKLDKIKHAIGQIRNVTVEIPAIPEDLELLKNLIRELKDLGVNFLNLHQLRLTPHNFENLIQRNYTFLHGNKVTVLESELTALKLIEYGIKNKIDLPINYCSFVYKNRFQNAAARKRVAPEIMEHYESTTESGFLRQIKCTGTKEVIKAIQSKIEKEESLRVKFKAISEQEFYIHPEALSMVLDESKSFQSDLSFRLSYFHVKLLSGLSYRNPFKEIRLSDNKKIVVEKMQASEVIELDGQEIYEFNTVFMENTSDFTTYENIPKWNLVARFEWIEEGLQEYF